MDTKMYKLHITWGMRVGKPTKYIFKNKCDKVNVS